MERTSRLVTPCQLQLLLQVDARFNSNAKTLDGTQNMAFRCIPKIRLHELGRMYTIMCSYIS